MCLQIQKLLFLLMVDTVSLQEFSFTFVIFFFLDSWMNAGERYHGQTVL